MAEIDESYTDLLPSEDTTLAPLNEDGVAAATESGAYVPPGADRPTDKTGTPSRRRGSSLIPAADVKGVIFNLMNAVIGVGVLAMPYCFKRAGLLLAPILLLIVGWLTERSLVLMVRAGDILREQEGETSQAGGLSIGYSATVARCFGPSMGTFADILIVVMNFGSGVAYLDVIADILAAWIGHPSKNVGLLLVVLFVVGPLSCVKAIESLKFTSLLGLCIYGAFALITILLFFVDVNCGGTVRAPAASIDLLVAIPIQTLAFACHTVVFPVYREFREVPGSTAESFHGAIRTTIGLCAAMYVTVGFFGTMTFKENTLGDVLKNYSSEGSLCFCSFLLVLISFFIFFC
jgi:amino acid permease